MRELGEIEEIGGRAGTYAHLAFSIDTGRWLFVFTGLLDTSVMACDFAQRAVLEPLLERHVRDGKPMSPLRLLQCSDDPDLQRLCAANHATAQSTHVMALPPRPVCDGRRLRIAYLSQDFRDHPVCVHGAALWERHDRSRFEVFAISTGADDASAPRRRAMDAFEHFVDVRTHGDEAVARWLQQTGIDILVDLGGHTAGARLGILTNKPQELTDLLVPRLGIAGLFDAVWGAGRMSYTKPDPRIFHDVVAACGGGPAIMIGDSITDLNTGRAAGAKVILMSYGYTPVAASELGADIVLDDFSALRDAMTALL